MFKIFVKIGLYGSIAIIALGLLFGGWSINQFTKSINGFLTATSPIGTAEPTIPEDPGSSFITAGWIIIAILLLISTVKAFG